MNIGYPIKDEFEVTDTYSDYWVKVDGEVVFSGKAWQNPYTGKATVYLNDIIKPYLKIGDLPTASDYINWVCNVETSSGFITDVTNVQEPISDNVTFLSKPIGRYYDPRQLLLISWLASNPIYINGERQEEFDTANVIAEHFSGNLTITGPTTLSLLEACGDYAIYYTNSLGGWDSLLVKSATITTDRTDYEYTDEFNTVNRYLTNSTDSTNVVSHYGIQTENVRELLLSNKVYLHNLTDNTIKRVIVDTTSYTTNKRLTRVELTLKDAQTYSRW